MTMHRSYTVAGCLPTLLGLAGILVPLTTWADAPTVSYIFPAGGQRGTTVPVRVGGHYLYEEAPFEMLGDGVKASPVIRRIGTVWFEGPVIAMPESQQKEDYPKDQAGQVEVAPDASLGIRYWRTWTSQGVTPVMKFVVGDLPELVEDEVDGDPLPTPVKLPITINGRIFPREDVDIWSFEARAGETFTCDVNAARLGSPLEARLEIRDPQGQRLAEESSGFGLDARLRFTAPSDGVYQLHIHDVNFAGLQHYVYRLTVTAGPYVDFAYPLGGQRGTVQKFELSGNGVPTAVDIPLPKDGLNASWQRVATNGSETNPFVLELDDLPEAREVEPNNDLATAQALSGSVIANGRIGTPGDVDCWKLTGKAGDTYSLDLHAAQLGSPLDAVLVAMDAMGKELARADDRSGAELDPKLQFAIPAGGTCYVRVEERVSSRGSPRFGYRLRVTPLTNPDFQLRQAVDSLIVNRAGQANLKLSLDRAGGFAGDVELTFEGLPADVTPSATKIAANQNEIQITFKATETARVDLARVQIHGSAKVDEVQVKRTAVVAAPFGDPELRQLALCVALPTPFKYKGLYESKYAPRGATFVRHYQIERGEYKGPLVVSLADRQFRHLQGATGPTFTLAPDATEFDYPVYLPPYMEVGRTSRTTIMLSGIVEDAEGRQHTVSYSSGEQNDQVIVIVDPGQLSLQSDRKSLLAAPGKTADVEVLVSRDPALVDLPVTVELVVPNHIRGVSALPIEVAAGASRGRFELKFAENGVGPLNMPLTLRASVKVDGRSVVAESKLELMLGE